MVLHSNKGQCLSAGKLCIEVAPTSKVSWISEELCIGCGICVKVRCKQTMCPDCQHTPVRIQNHFDFSTEMPFRCYHDHQLAKESGKGDDAPIQCQLLQASQTPSTTARTGLVIHLIPAATL